MTQGRARCDLARGSPPSLAVTAFWLSAGERLPLRVEPLSAGRYGWAIAYEFGKAPGELALHELALLVALPKAPSRFEPTRYPDRARSARDAVLHGLLNAGAIEASDCAAALAKPLGVTPTAPRRTVP